MKLYDPFYPLLIGIPVMLIIYALVSSHLELIAFLVVVVAVITMAWLIGCACIAAADIIKVLIKVYKQE